MPAADIDCLFSSHYSHPKSALTFEERGKTKPAAPASIVDLCVDNGIKDCLVVDNTLGGVLEAYKNLKAAGVSLRFGYKVVVCADHLDKSEKSLNSESKAIIFVREMAGYSTLIKIANRAKTEGFYYQGRTSWSQLKSLWDENLTLALPFFSSFVARNTLTLQTIVPDLPMAPILLREVESGLPFAPLIDRALDQYAASNSATNQLVKSVYYRDRKSFEPYIVYNAKHKRSTFVKPNLDHFASDRFAFAEWKRLVS